MQNTTSNLNAQSAKETVVCIHSSGNSAKQWKRLATDLDGRFDVHAVDLYGAGDGPAWRGGPLRLEDEVAQLAVRFQDFEGSFHLVGHSYGGAVAARIAAIYPHRVNSLCLFEPVLFNLLDERRADSAAREDFRAMRRTVRHWMWLRNPAAAAQHFIDYWSGSGAWSTLPEWAQGAMVRKMSKILLELDTPKWDTYRLSEYSALTQPALLLWGEEAPASTREISRLLMRQLPNVRGAGLAGVGHMGPVTHPGRVNPMIEAFLKKYSTKEVLPLAA